MRTFLIALASMAFLASISLTPAVAGGSIYAPETERTVEEPLFNGPYIGAFGAYSTGSWDKSFYEYDQKSFKNSDFQGGVQLGLNYHRGNAVFGLVADYTFGDLGASVTYSGDGWSETYSGKLENFWTARLLAGYAKNRWLAYVTAGIAGATFDNAYLGVEEFKRGPEVWADSASHVLFGFTAGAGLEYKLNRNWSFKTEYLYASLGDIETLWMDSSGDVVRDVDLHTVRVGVSYGF